LQLISGRDLTMKLDRKLIPHRIWSTEKENIKGDDVVIELNPNAQRSMAKVKGNQSPSWNSWSCWKS
jgi:hypothetical protein